MPAPTEADIYSDRDAAPDIAPDHVDDVKEDEARDSSDSDNDKDEKDGDKSSESATGLVSKTFFGDKELKPGTTCKVRVEKVYDDQVSISYVPHGKSDSDDDDDESEEKVEEDIYD